MRSATHHLDDHELPARVHFARLCLPDTSCCCIHPSPKTCDNTTNHHGGYSVAGTLDDGTNADDSAADQDLTRTPELVASEDSAHSADEAPDVIDRCHRALGVCRGMAERLKEILRNDDIAEYTLVVAVEDKDQRSRAGTRSESRNELQCGTGEVRHTLKSIL